MNVSDAKSGITNFQKLPACAEAHARDHVLRKGLLTPHLRGVRGSRAYSARGKSTQQRNEGREIRTPNLLIWSQTRCRCAIPPMRSCFSYHTLWKQTSAAAVLRANAFATTPVILQCCDR